jgi:hypothetical protein
MRGQKQEKKFAKKSIKRNEKADSLPVERVNLVLNT